MNALVPAAISGEILSAEVRVTWIAHPIRDDKTALKVDAGKSLAEIIADVCVVDGQPVAPSALKAWVDGRAVAPEDWATTYPAEDVLLRRVPAPFLIPLIPIIATTLATATGITAGLAGAIGVSVAVAGAIIGAAASVLALGIGMLFRPSAPSLQNLSVHNQEPSATYTLSGFQNAINRFGVVPFILGTHRIFPPYAAQPNTQIIGQDQYLICYFLVGYSQTDVSDMRIGETPISAFQDVTTSVAHIPAGGDLPTSWVGVLPADELALNIDLGTRYEPAPPTILTTSLNTDAISVDLVAPQGVYATNTKTGAVEYHVTGIINVDFRLVGTSTWSTVPTQLVGSVRGEVVRKGVYVNVARGQYEVRVQNLGDPEQLNPYQLVNQVFWTALRSHRRENILDLPYDATLAYVRIRANEQLSGTLDTFNLIGKFRGWRYDGGGSWTSGEYSSNPASAFRTVLQWPGNVRAVADSVIDFDSLDAFGDDCIANGWTYDRVHDFEGSVFDALRDICAAGRGEPTFVDGKWGVMWERIVPEPIVQSFTPRDTMSFSGQRSFLPELHGVRVRFVNKFAGYEQDERAVYDDGYNDANADPGRVEELELPGVTDPNLVWKLGRWHLAQQRLRRELYTIEVDIQQVVCRRGDRVKVNHDVPLWGLGYGRVKAIDVWTVTLDTPVIMEAGKSYVLGVRTVAEDGSHAEALWNLLTMPGEHYIVEGTSGNMSFAVGDSFRFGELDAESVVLRVKSIRPGQDLSAVVELVDDGLGVLQADSGAIPPFVTNISRGPDAMSLFPRDVRLTSTPTLIDGQPFEILRVSFIPPLLGGIAKHEIAWKAGAETTWPRAMSVDGAAREGTIVVAPGEWQVRVRSHLSAPLGINRGTVTAWSAVASISARSVYDRPTDVTGARIIINGDRATLSWEPFGVGQQLGVEVRHATRTSGATVGNSRILAANVVGGSVQVPNLRGTYLLRWKSYGGVYSSTAAAIVNLAADLVHYNVVETIEEQPAFAGETTGAVVVGTGEITVGGGGGGGYEFANTVDLGAVYPCRLYMMSDVSAANITSKFFSGRQFFTGSSFFSVEPEDWSASHEFRSTEDDPSGSPTWSDWQEMTAGEATARAFEFRVVLTSNNANVVLTVTELEATIDMPDRIVPVEDVVTSTSATTVAFSPAFKELRNVHVTIQGLTAGQQRFIRVTNKTASSADVLVINEAGTAVAATVDVIGVGYGVAA